MHFGHHGRTTGALPYAVVLICSVKTFHGLSVPLHSSYCWKPARHGSTKRSHCRPRPALCAGGGVAFALVKVDQRCGMARASRSTRQACSSLPLWPHRRGACHKFACGRSSACDEISALRSDLARLRRLAPSAPRADLRRAGRLQTIVSYLPAPEPSPRGMYSSWACWRGAPCAPGWQSHELHERTLLLWPVAYAAVFIAFRHANPALLQFALGDLRRRTRLGPAAPAAVDKEPSIYATARRFSPGPCVARISLRPTARRCPSASAGVRELKDFSRRTRCCHLRRVRHLPDQPRRTQLQRDPAVFPPLQSPRRTAIPRSSSMRTNARTAPPPPIIGGRSRQPQSRTAGPRRETAPTSPPH